MTITFADIHQEIEAGNQKLIPKSAALAYIDFFAAVFPDRWREKPARTGWFKANFPYAAPRVEADMTIFRGPRLYRRWRAGVLNLIIAFGESETETPKEALYILAKNSGMTGLTDFKSALRLAFADDFALKELTREAAFEAEKALDPKARLRFRHALSQLDRMRFIPRVQTSELLGPTLIGQLPKLRRNGQYEVEMPPRLAQFLSGLKPLQAGAVISVYNVCIGRGIFGPDEDVCPRSLLEPERQAQIGEVLQAEFTQLTAKVYLGRMKSAVESMYPELLDGWQLLRQRVRELAPELDLGIFSYLSTISNGLPPGALNQDWFERMLAAEPAQVKRTQIKRAARLMNDLRGIADGQLLPLLPPEPFVVEQTRTQGWLLPDVLGAEFDAWSSATKASKSKRKQMRCALRILWTYRSDARMAHLFNKDHIDGAFDRAEDLSDIVRKQYRAAAHRFRLYRGQVG